MFSFPPPFQTMVVGTLQRDLSHFPKGRPGSSSIPGNFHCDAVFILGGMFSEVGQLLDPAPVLLLAHGEVLAINGEEME